MTPELETALAPIGWGTVKRVAPWFASFAAASLNATGGRLSRDRPSASQALQQHHELMKAMEIVMCGLAHLTADERDTVDHWSRTPEQRDAGGPSTVSAAIEAPEVIVPGVIELYQQLAHEEGSPRRGRPRNEAAYRVALTLAEVYVVGRGRRPTYGNREDGKGPTGDYGRTVERVCGLLGIAVSDFTDYCREAIQSLSDERLAQLLAHRQPRRWGPSLFDLADE